MVSPEIEAKVAEVSDRILYNVKSFKQVPVKPKILLPTNPSDAMHVLAGAINESISEAKNIGVSPEKLAPLYNSLKGVLEITAEIQGSLDRSAKTLILNKINLKDEVEEYAKEIAILRASNQLTKIEN